MEVLKTKVDLIKFSELILSRNKSKFTIQGYKCFYF